MLTLNVLVAISLIYVIALFSVAYVAERRAARGKAGWLRAPMIYTLSLSVYCTAWTFYGAVGYAARSGLEFVTIYLGPTLVFIGWWWLLRKLVRIGRSQRITSIADLISSRYGKSNSLAVIVTLMAVTASTPYIALQLQSVALSFSVFAPTEGAFDAFADQRTTAMWVAIGLAVFTVLFGTRNLDANERHHGVVMAIAVEAIVKLVALLAVGAFVVWGMAGGIGPMLDRIDQSPVTAWDVEGSRWVGLIFVSAAAVITLPRMFQVLVVENADEAHLSTASWAFPGYLLLMSLFVIPIAVMGLESMPAGSNPDLFVVTLPLSQDQNALAALAFLGGFSSATSMVIVASIALSTMVSNHIIMPIWLSFQEGGASVSGDVRRAMLRSRRASIAAVMTLGYGYYALSSGSEALAAIGLIAFVGAAQVLPALIGAIFWRGATRRGAAAGLIAGFVVWAYTLYLPSFGASGPMSGDFLSNGPGGLAALRPQALFGLVGLDPLVHALLWSMVLNTGAFLVVSLMTFPSPMERLQGAQFVNIFEHSNSPRSWTGGMAEAEDLLVMAQRILGAREAQSLFVSAAEDQGKSGYLPEPTPDFLALLERELAGSVGAATAHAMISQINGGASVSVRDLMAVADETAQMMEYSSQLEAKSQELEAIAGQLREANEKLTELSIQKDAFLSQISHELRTPMTSIRSFSEILMEGSLEETERQRYSKIIHGESIRLTRLLDDLLDLSVLENGQVVLNPQTDTLEALLDRAVASTVAAGQQPRSIRILRTPGSESITLHTDTDRLVQVFINIIANSIKYCDAPDPELRIDARHTGDELWLDFIDNGSGIPARSEAVIFEKFARIDDQSQAGGAGLGLAICREIMVNLRGSIRYMRGYGGAAFRVTLPIHLSQAA
ncbi:MAG: ATP-binding protein [Pseudomonadota bacterium]